MSRAIPEMRHTSLAQGFLCRGEQHGKAPLMFALVFGRMAATLAKKAVVSPATVSLLDAVLGGTAE